MGKPVIMGRKTFESIGRPLDGRHNIVLTRRRDYVADGCTVANSVSEALQAAGGSEEVMVIGGGLVYEQFLPLAERLYVTLIDAEFDGDAFFPLLDVTDWIEVERETHEPEDGRPWRFHFLILDRRNSIP